VKKSQISKDRQLKTLQTCARTDRNSRDLHFHLNFYTLAQLNEQCSFLSLANVPKCQQLKIINKLTTQKLAPTDQMPAFSVDATEKLTANYSFSSNYFATFTFL